MSELSNDTLKIGISLAILCHCFGLMFLTAPAPSEEDFPMTVIVKLDSAQAAVSDVNFQRFPTLDAKKLVNAPKMSAHHRGICHF